MTRFGIIGFGFIGRMHLAALSGMENAEVVAVADKVPENLEGGTGGGNIGVQGDIRLDGVARYDSGDQLLAESDAEAVIIALPTYLHREYVLKAVQAKKHILCEKPMARTVEEGRAIVEALGGYDRAFMVGHCIRFWPAYAKAREVMLSGEYGAVRYAHFERKSPKPNWSWQNWIIDEDKSGGAVLDLHIHDTDYVLHAFGPPQQVCAAGLWEKGEGFGQMTALYDYGEGLTVLVEGGWAYKETFPFRMRFTAALDSATLEFDSSVDMNLRIHTDQGAIETPALPAADGYAQELAYFTECVERGQKPATVTAESSLEAMEAIQRECQAAAGGVAQPVP